MLHSRHSDSLTESNLSCSLMLICLLSACLAWGALKLQGRDLAACAVQVLLFAVFVI